MALRTSLYALAALVAALPSTALAAERGRPAAAPPGTAETRYCLRIEALTGSRIAQVKCWTREKWADQGVDVDKDWAEEGVRTIG